MPKVETTFKTQQLDKRLRAIIALNAAFVVLVALAWSPAVRFAADALQWATLEQVSLRGGMLDYPLTLMWQLPLAGAAVAWVLRQGGSQSASILAAAFPLVYRTTLALCHQLVPLMTG